MRIKYEIEKAIKKINAKNSDEKKNDNEIEEIYKKILERFKKGNYNFSIASKVILKQKNKTRIVKKFDDRFSTENILCQCIKQILDKEFKIKYPNRNKIMKSLFQYISSIQHMTDFTIIKFDFKNYFNSISSIYVYEKIIKKRLKDRYEDELIKKFVKETLYAYAGLQSSNVIAEIIGREFDEEIIKQFESFGMIFYKRYIDDGIIILNEFLTDEESKEKILDAVQKVFNINLTTEDLKCSTKINSKKFKSLSKRNMNNGTIYSIDFLGYELNFKKNNDKVDIMYGITESKKIKYEKRVKKIIKLYSDTSSEDYNNEELLRHRILAFSCRQVYISKKFKSNIWKAKGFISNYNELRDLLEIDNIIEEGTKKFLENVIQESFDTSKVEIPYFLKGKGKDAYSLYHNMLKNKTLLFVPHIGYSYESLSNLCQKIGISSRKKSGQKRSYGTLVREYLIKTKVGY